MGGVDKGWLMFRGTPFIARVLDALRPQVDEVLISANRHLSRYSALGVPVFTDAEGQGPLAGLVQLMAQARNPWLLCVPCDALLLPADWAQRFCEQAAERQADAVVLRNTQGWQPTFSLVRTALIDDARIALARGDASLRSFLFNVPVLASIDMPVPGNVNTPEDLQRLEQVS